MNGLTRRQVTYNNAFIFRVNSLLEDLFFSLTRDSDWQDVLEKRLEQSDVMVGAASATVQVATLAAPLSAGTSLLVAGAVLGTIGTCIVIAKAISGGYRVITRHNDDTTHPTIEEDTSLDEARLNFNILFQEVADILMLRYRHFIEEIIEEDSISAFAYYGAERVIKKFKLELRSQLKSHQQSELHFNPRELVDSLIEISYFPDFSVSEKIKLQAEHISVRFMSTNLVSAKWAYARARIAVCSYNPMTQKIENRYFASPVETTNFSTHTTLNKFGYATFSEDFLSMKDKPLYKIDVEEQLDNDEISARVTGHFCIYYTVLVSDVEEYLLFIRDILEPVKPSLNEFLSIKFGRNVIAECHDDRLRHLNLSGGNYTEVNFREVILEGLLENTIWQHARLSGAKFIGTNLVGSDFSYAFLEKTEWSNLTLTGNFNYSKMNGAIISNSKIGDILAIGCDWNLVHMDDVTHDFFDKDKWLEIWTKEFIDRLEYESEQRLKFASWQKIQEKKWDKQEEINTSYLERISMVEQWIGEVEHQPIISILNIIRTNGQRFFSAIISQPYIELNAMPAGVGDMLPIPLADSLMNFKNNPKELFFLLHGSIGSGKTMSVVRFMQELLLSCTTMDDVYPILIKLKHVRDKTAGNFLEACLLTEFSRSEIEVLKTHFRCLIVLDGLDECGIDFNTRYLVEECLAFNESCLKGSWKIVFTSSTQLLLEAKNYRELLRFSKDVYFPFESEYSILPLNREQIETYIHRYYPHGINLSDNRFRDLADIAQTPIMLHIICEVWSVSSPEIIGPIARIDFYNKFLQNWSEHALKKAEESELTRRSLLLSLQAMAYEMFTKHTQQVEWSIKDDRDILEIVRDNRIREFNYLEDALWRQAGRLTPITVVRDEERGVIICKVRSPFRLYALALKLIDILQEPLDARLTGWNYSYLTEPATISIFDLLEELIELDERKDILIRLLCEMVASSCGNEGRFWSKAASNAITVLNYLEFDFSSRLESLSAWRGLHVPEAILRYAKLSKLDLSEGDISNAKLHGAELVDVRLFDTDVSGVQFFDGMSAIYTDGQPETFAVYPSDETIIAYSVLKKSGSEDRDIILLGANGTNYQRISGHKTEIKSMAWGVTNTLPHIAHLAAASANGIIRIWQVLGDSHREIAVLKSSNQKAINSVRWFKDGKLLASGGEDQCLRIWNVVTKKCIFNCNLNANIQEVIFGRDKNIFLAVDDSGALRVWALKDIKKARSHRKTQFNSITHPSELVCASSVSLAVPEERAAVGYVNGDILIVKLEIEDCPSDAPSIISLETLIILKEHTGRVNSLIWNAHCLSSGSDDGKLMVWSPDTGLYTSVYQGDGSPLKKIAWLTGGRQIIANQSRMLSIYDPDYRSENVQFSIDMNHLVTKISALSNLVAIGHIDGKVGIWDVTNPVKKNMVRFFYHTDVVTELLWSHNEQYLASLGKDNVVNILDNRYLDVDDRDIFAIRLEVPVRQIAWVTDPSTNEQILVITFIDKKISCWSIISEERFSSWERRSNLAGIPDNIGYDVITTNIVDSSSVKLAIGSKGNIYVCDVTQQSYRRMVLPNAHDDLIAELVFSKDNEFLLVKYVDEAIKIFHIDTGKLIWLDRTSSSKKHILWIQTSDESQYLLVGTKDEVRIFSFSRGVNRILFVQSILPGVDNLAYAANNLFLVDSKSVDMLNFTLLLANEDTHSAFITRFGRGTNFRGLDLSGSKKLSTENKRFAAFQGAIVPVDPGLRRGFSSMVWGMIGANRGPQRSRLPSPNYQEFTTSRSYDRFFRSDCSDSAESNSPLGLLVNSRIAAEEDSEGKSQALDF